MILAVWGCCAIARRFFRRDADFISQLLLVGIVLNLAAYIPSTLADHSALNVREIAPVLPFAAVLAARMLGDRLLALGPAVRVRLPRLSRPLRLKLIVIPLVALFGWYSFGLFQQADTPAAADPFTGLEQFLEANGLSYGLGGYWEASVITVDTGGAVTIRAVSPSCIQPYAWENKREWYDPAKNVANFLVMSNQPGYFSSFQARGAALAWLNNNVSRSDRRDTSGLRRLLLRAGSRPPRPTTTRSGPTRATSSAQLPALTDGAEQKAREPEQAGERGLTPWCIADRRPPGRLRAVA